MAHITYFTVSGLAGRHERFSQELDRTVNVFFGLNGSGKTSLLKLLDSAMSGDASTIMQVPFETAEVGVYSQKFKQTFVRKISRASLKVAAPGTTQVAWTDATGGVYRIDDLPGAKWDIEPPLPADSAGDWLHTFLPITRMYEATYSGSKRVALRVNPGESIEDQLNRTFASALRGTWTEYVTTVVNSISAAQADGLANILESVLNAREDESVEAIDPRVAYKRVTAFLRRQGSVKRIPSAEVFGRRLETDPRLSSIVSDIDRVEKRIAEANAPRTRLQDLISRLFTGKTVEFGDSAITVQSDTKQSFDLGRLSSGEKQVLRLLVEALRVGNNTLLIDEPELSMHVDWQQHLVESMLRLNPHTQLVMATHSPEIMAELPDSKIFKL